MIIRNFPGRSQIGPVLYVFVSEDKGLMCFDIEVSSPSKVERDTIFRRVAPWARQSSEQIEGTDTVYKQRDTAVPGPKPKIWICASGPTAFPTDVKAPKSTKPLA